MISLGPLWFVLCRSICNEQCQLSVIQYHNNYFASSNPSSVALQFFNTSSVSIARVNIVVSDGSLVAMVVYLFNMGTKYA